MERKTPLYDRHVAAGGRMVPFGGYLMPVQYSGVIEEHMAVRQKAGLFDVSHMAEVIFSGPDALKNLNNLFCNDFTSMTVGKVRYSPMLNEKGGIVDDMIIYKMGEEKYMLVPNASNREKDVTWMKARLSGNVKMEDISDNVAQLAIQGPSSKKILGKLTDESKLPTGYYTFVENLEVSGVNCIVSRTGYTGELGYELYFDPPHAEKLWDAILEAGKADGLIPCGLGARDTLRLEAGMPLYGHEMSDDISPLETGLQFTVKMQKDDFIGKKGLEERGEPKVARVGMKITGRGIAREECPIFFDGKKVGVTTSGTHLPFLGGAYAAGLVDIAHTALGTKLEIEVRGKKIAAEIVPLPFYKAPK